MKIIVIEDNPDLNELLVEALAASGHSAAGFLSVEAFEVSGAVGDIYMLDLNLPGEDGLAFAARLRAQAPQVGVVVLSVRAGTDVRSKSYETGVDIYLQKPCDSREIVAAINAMARRIAPVVVSAPVGLTLHPLWLRLVGPDGETQVTLAEVALLQAFARAPDNLVTYAETQQLLGSRNAPLLATIEVRITRLRKKIAEAVKGQRTIVSVRNVGYRLMLPLTVAEEGAA